MHILGGVLGRLLSVAVVALLATGVYGAQPSDGTAKPSATARSSSAVASGDSLDLVSTTTRVSLPLRLRRPLFVDPDSQAVHAASGDPRFAPLATTPQARWFTDGTAPVGEATAVVRAYADAARRAEHTPVAVLYAIPGRDCGLHSAGGLPERTYRQWVQEVAVGLRGARALVMLEPDAVAMLGECSGQGNRVSMLAYATKTLTANGSWVYLDAGHSRWHSPTVMAERLVQAGVQYARGFFTNASNYRSTSDERLYGRQIVEALARQGVRGKNFVIDVSRNGVGPDQTGEWCNSGHARVGVSPRVVNRGGPLDALLWVKRPGESDGACNGGPSAGQWWSEGALRLLGLAG